MTHTVFDWDQANRQLLLDRIADLERRIDQLNDQADAARVRISDQALYIESLQERIIRHERSYRALADKHDRAYEMVRGLIAALERYEEA